jgi:EAL domain-containing protein (putative c-di-GMP-specific phosphodiesterase class I)
VPQYRLPAHQRLSHALSQDEFRIFYQPVIDLQCSMLVGAEALCRWPQHEGSFTSPESFITQAETSGFIVTLGEWVLRKASEQLRTWQRESPAKITIAVNLSSRQFLHFNLIKSIEEALRTPGLRPHSIEFEITESVGLGTQLALDDFGTQADFLRDCGCEFAQGYLFGPALPPDDFQARFLVSARV